MPDLEISNLPALAEAGVQGTDPVAVADLSASETKKVTVKDLIAAGVSLIDDGDIPAAKVATPFAANAVATATIQNLAVTAGKIANNTITANQIATNAITATELADNAVDTDAIANAAVTDIKLATNSVTGVKIASNAITEGKIADGSVTNAKLTLTDGSIAGSKIASGGITATQLSTNSVTATELADNAVDTNAILNNAVVATKIASGVITSAHLAADSVTNTQIADNAVGTDQIADGAVTAAKLSGTLAATSLANDAVTTNKIEDDAVTSDKLATNAVDANALADSSVDANAIINGVVTNAKLANSSISLGGLNLSLGSTDATPALNLVDATNYPTSSLTGTITNAQLAGSIAGTKLLNSTIDYAKLNLADGVIPGAKLTNASVTATQIAQDTITANELANNAVDSSAIASNAVISAKIAANAVTGAKIANTTISASKLDTTTLDRSLNVASGNLGINNAITAATRSGITYNAQGLITGTAALAAADLPVATTTAVGGVSVGSGLTVSGAGALSITNSITGATVSGITYNAQGMITAATGLVAGDLPVATTSAKGAVQITSGGGLTVDGSGNLTTSTSGVSAGTFTKITVNNKGVATAGTTLVDTDIPDIPATKITSGTIDAARIGNGSIDGTKLSNASTAVFQSIAQQGYPTAQFNGQILFDTVSEDAFIWDGNAWQAITTLTKGSLVFGGNYNANTSKMTACTTAGLAAGLAVGSNLPTPSATTDGLYVVVDTAGTPAAPAPVVSFSPPDYILGVTNSSGSSWNEIDLSQTVAGQVASNITFTPYGQLSSTNVQDALQELETEKMGFAGGTVSGQLLIGNTGSLAFEGSTVDAYELTLAVSDPQGSDKTITFPDVTGNVVTTGDTGTITGTMLANDTIQNVDIKSDAAIAFTKLANLNSAQILVGNGSNKATAVAVTGDISINNAGLTAIASGVIVDGDISGSAAITGSKITTGTTSAVGVLQLTDSTNSTSATTAATPNAVKTVNDALTTTTATANAALPKAGGTMTDHLTIDNGKEIRFSEVDSNGSNYVALRSPDTLSTDITFVLPSSAGTGGQILRTAGSGVFEFTDDINGNAATATVLANARTIGGVSFNGSANIDLPGVNTAGNQDTTGNAATTTALATARTIGGVSFDGTANINLPGVNASGTQDTSGTAALATQFTVTANNTTDETVYPLFSDGATGSQGAETDTGFTYNPSTGVLTSTSFAGNLTGNVTGNITGDITGDLTGTADLATQFTVTANNSTDETVYPLFVDGATGSQGAETDTGLTYNPSTGMLTSTGFTGALTGNASTATALATARTINGTSFDGSANILVPKLLPSSGQSGTALEIIDSGSNAHVTIDLDGSEKFRFTSDGEFLIGTTGSSVAAAVADQFVINSSGNGGMSIIGGTTHDGHIFFGDTDAALRGGISYNHDGDYFYFRAAGDTERFRISSTGAAVTGGLTVSGDLTVSGTTTTVNSTQLDVTDKNITMGNVSTPTDSTADGGGLTLKGATDKTFNWVNSTDAWTSSEHIQVASGKTFIGNVTGNVTGDLTGTATNATHVYLTDNENTNENNLIPFVENGASSTGNHGLEMDGDLTYTPALGRLTATQLAGTLVTAAQTNITSLGTLTGLTVNGDLTLTGASANVTWDKSTDDLIFNDSARAIFGTNSDGLEIYHESNNSYIADTGTGALIFKSNTYSFRNAADNEQIAKFNENGSVELYHNDVKTFETEDNGAYIYGPDGGIAQLMLYADRGDDNADKWRMATSASASEFTLFNFNDGAWETSIKAIGSSGVELYRDNVKKLETDGNGINVIDNDSTVEVSLTDSNGAAGHVYGNSSSGLIALLVGNGGTSVAGYQSGATQLFHSNSKKLETSSSGVTVTGTVSDSKGDLRSIPQNAQTGSSIYEFVAADAGKHVLRSGGHVRLPSNIFAAGTAITIINNSSSNINVISGSGVTLYNTADGNTGQRTLAARAMATVIYTTAGANQNVYISGSGVS